MRHLRQFLVSLVVVQFTAAICLPMGSQYLDCVAASLADADRQCCFSEYPGLAHTSSNCQPPFGFCHEHTVGLSFDRAGNVDVPKNVMAAIPFYRCGAYQESCEAACTNPAYSSIMENSGQERLSTHCLPFEFDKLTMDEYQFTLRRWDVSTSAAAP